MRLRTKVLDALTRPPTNAYLISADIGHDVQGVKNVLAWAEKKRLAERVSVPGYEPHYQITYAGKAYLEREGKK